jgi:hypothetical protein
VTITLVLHQGSGRQRRRDHRLAEAGRRLSDNAALAGGNGGVELLD